MTVSPVTDHASGHAISRQSEIDPVEQLQIQEVIAHRD
jgi:hypothetical protein